MRLSWFGQATLFTLLSTTTITTVRADSAGALYPPGLLPLINHANSLLSAGQFSDAAKAYTEAIGKKKTNKLFFSQLSRLRL
jgi:DnaJ family protein C protein 3